MRAKLQEAACGIVANEALALGEVFKPPPSSSDPLPPLPQMSELLASAESAAPWLVGMLARAMDASVHEAESGGSVATHFSRVSGNVRNFITV